MKKYSSILFVLAAGTLWGSMGIFVRHFSAIGLAPLDISTLRSLSGLITLGLYLLLFNRKAFFINIKDIWCFIGTGIGSFYLLNLTYYTAMQYTSLAVAGVLLYTAPIFVMLFGALLFREPLTKSKLIALALAFIGCVLVSGVGSGHSISPAGFLWGIGSGLSYALYSVFGRYAIRRGYNSWTITFYSFFFCFIASSFTCDYNAIIPLLPSVAEIIWILTLGICTAFLPYLFYSKGLEAMDGGKASVIASIEPVVATLISIFIFSEPMNKGIIGIVFVLAAIVILAAKPKEI